ncbi:MAG TPA: helix-hairpin-helix domain-containing protein [Dermatophilaceae bacterium]|nr:helix-hairpin-helix domain-containing protein [Dermatophilaceae bacterium]
MPRRRLESPSADRLAAILGIPSAPSPSSASPQLAGWVPQRTSLDTFPAVTVEPATFEDNGRHRRPAPPKPAILTVPVGLRGVRARPRRLAALGVMVLLLTAAVVLGIRVAWARSVATPQPVAATAHGPPDGLVSRTVPAAFASGGAAGLPTVASVLLVHVVGQVRRPGVVRLPQGSRVLDAVRAAGGATSSADLNHLNLARPVADGEQIVVPKPGESILQGGVPGVGGTGAGSPSGAGSVGGLIDLNVADAAALDSLPGVGPVLAQRILDWRAQHGRFTSVDELGEVSGIGDKILATIRPKVTV